MFTDKRSKKVVLLSHCIINQNAKSDGTAYIPSSINPILDLLTNNEIGIIQMPCPELICLGLDRGNPFGADSEIVIENSRIRTELEKVEQTEKIIGLAKQTVFQIEEYIKHGFKFIGLIGINRSPSCGIETTSKDNKEVNGHGIFIDALKAEFNAKNIPFRMIGIKTFELEKSLSRIEDFI